MNQPFTLINTHKALRTLLTLIATIGVTLSLSFTHASTFASAAEENATTTPTFENVKKASQPIDMSFDGIPAKLWVQLIKDSGRIKDVVFYGELQMPYTAMDIGVEEFESQRYMPEDDNHVYVNTYLKSKVLWAPSNDKYMNTVFMSDGILHSQQETFTLTINGHKEVITILKQATTLNTDNLTSAINEHWNAYTAAKTAGMLFTNKSEESYLKADTHARKLLEQTQKVDPTHTDSPSQEELNQETNSLNKIAAELKPLPFNRDGLKNTVAKADALLASNGKNGKRIILSDYKAIQDTRIEALQLLKTPDLETILVPAHQEAPVTHKTFEHVQNKLEKILQQARMENYTPESIEELTEKYDQAVAFTPDSGKRFSNEGRKKLIATLQDVRRLLDSPMYAEAERIQSASHALTLAMQTAQEPLKGEKFSVRVRYQYPMKDSVSALLQSYFTQSNGHPIEEVFTAREGEEIRLSIKDPLIKKFPGYTPSSFHLNSDDGTLGFVQVLTNSRGESTIAFSAHTANASAGASLDIRYVEGEDTRFNASIEHNIEPSKDHDEKPASSHTQSTHTHSQPKKPSPKEINNLSNTGSTVAHVIALSTMLSAAGFFITRRARTRI